MFTEIDARKKLLDAKRPLPVHTVQSLQEHLLIEWTYHSNAIEGNTLTLAETQVVLEGITVGGKTLREHLEVINHREAILYIEEIVKKDESLSEWQIKNIHHLIVSKIDDENAGAYRRENVRIAGAKYIPPPFYELPGEMERLIQWYEGDGRVLHPVERAAQLHIRFVGIHPFAGGNGRTSRLLLNLELMKHGYPPVVIHRELRTEYYDSLDQAHTTGDCRDFIVLVEAELKHELDTYLKLLDN
ncbi:filamentation induced by cAMP protein Fic [Acetonema longum DSM 6540]|uniref:Filamentation induced by cAMP protein Fic n=1 Tax=Acetonema longum DSM 6540 TaxID=1009370 RepID=F7NG54_9FIRM|nr:Fic family protein [Acetonema longum]EGO64972.1 filamentation induced by cAMP protein Fic [Acetonema longum DSM 6540]